MFEEDGVGDEIREDLDIEGMAEGDSDRERLAGRSWEEGRTEEEDAPASFEGEVSEEMEAGDPGTGTSSTMMGSLLLARGSGWAET